MNHLSRFTICIDRSASIKSKQRHFVEDLINPTLTLDGQQSGRIPVWWMYGIITMCRLLRSGGWHASRVAVLSSASSHLYSSTTAIP